MKRFAGLFRNRNFILLLAVVLGLSTGKTAEFTQPAVLPVMALVMTLSIADISSKELLSLREMFSRVSVSLFLNFVVMGGIMIAMATWLVKDEELLAGCILAAAVPPATAVVPFSYVLGGSTLLSLLSMIATYLLALVVTPAIILIFLGIEFFDPVTIMVTLAEVIVAPIILSRILLFTGAMKRIGRWRGTMVNWCFFIIVSTIIGLNRATFFEETDAVLIILLIGICCTFVLGHIVELVTRLLKVDRETSVSWILLATKKNFGLSGALALALFSEKASVPGSVAIVPGIIHVVWLSFYFKKLAPAFPVKRKKE